MNFLKIFVRFFNKPIWRSWRSLELPDDDQRSSPAPSVDDALYHRFCRIKPVTDEERDQIFGSQSSNSEDGKVTTTKRTKEVAKKKKNKAPNSIRKTKKPARL